MVSNIWCTCLLVTCLVLRCQATSTVLADCPVIDSSAAPCCEGSFLFRVIWYGRLGNNLLQLAQALYLAELTQNEVAIPAVSHFNRTFWDFRAGTEACQLVKADEFFFSRVCPSALNKSAFTVARKRQVLQTHVLPSFTIPIGDHPDSVVLHIRSGDVFSDPTPHPDYTQPPFAFYKHVLGLPELKRLKIILCTEDTGNPVVNLVKKYYRTRIIEVKTLESAISAILGAKRLILGQSSFSELLGMMAPNLEAVYIPFCLAREDIYVQHNVQGWGVPGYCFEYDNYTRLDEWANTSEQRELMSNFSTKNMHKFALPL